MEAKAKTAMVCLSEGMTLTINITQMKLFTAIATAVVLGGSLIATTISASAQTTYRVTPRYGGGYKVRGSNGYSGTYRPRYGGGGTYRDSNGGGYRYKPRYGGGGTYTFN